MNFAKLQAALGRWFRAAGPAGGRTTEAEYDEALAAIRGLQSLFEDGRDRRKAVGDDDATRMD